MGNPSKHVFSPPIKFNAMTAFSLFLFTANSPPPRTAPFLFENTSGCSNQGEAPVEKFPPPNLAALKNKNVSLLNAMFFVEYFLTMPDCLLHVAPSKSCVYKNQTPQPKPFLKRSGSAFFFLRDVLKKNQCQ
jgi:hypothetical protein